MGDIEAGMKGFDLEKGVLRLAIINSRAIYVVWN